MNLIFKLIAGLVLGIATGLFAPELMVRVFVTFKVIFSDFIAFMIPFIIIFFIASAMADLGKKAGRIVGLTMFIAYLSTVVAALLAYFVSSKVVGHLTLELNAITAETGMYQPFIHIEIIPVMGVIAALLIAFLVGIGMTHVQGLSLRKVVDESKHIVQLVLEKIIIPFLPVYIFTIFAELTAEGVIFPILEVFAVILVLVILMHFVWLTLQYTVAGVMTKQNPFVLLKGMIPAYFTAVGTMSSVAAIPVTLRCVKANKVREQIADFAVPLCASIHLSGSIITITTCAVAVAAMTTGLGIPSFTQMLPLMLMLGVIMVAAPGVPGGAVMASLGVLIPGLGFNEAAIGLMVVLYMAQDSFGTATNVTGDGAINIIVDKLTR